MKLPLYNQKGEEIGEVSLPKEVFGLKVNADLLHQATVTQMANGRINIAHTKKRGEVRGGGKKPWKQKGTGRARHGSIRSPIWIGGGVVFGPRNEVNFSKKINKQMKKKALLMSLSSKALDQQIVVMDKITSEKGKTKEVAITLKNIGNKIGGKKIQNALVVLPKKDEMVRRAISNVKNSNTVLANSLNVVDVLSHTYLIVPQESIDIIKNTYAV